MSQIECKDVSVKYENQVVLEDISFSIEQGDYLCIVGENGSGKSTLVKTILGLENSKLFATTNTGAKRFSSISI